MAPSTRSPIDLAVELHQRYPDEWLRALANPRRRRLLHVLRDLPVPADRAEVARRLATRETDQAIEHVDGDAVRDVLISLHHHHLPRLAEAGIIEYRHRTGTIERCRLDEGVGLVEV